MDFLRKFWPHAFACEKPNVKGFVITLVLYCVASFVIGFVAGLFARVPGLNIILSAVSYLFSLYSTAGIVFSILKFVGVFK